MARADPTATETPGDASCGYDCHYQEPYGFVPEADCPVHDPPQHLSNEVLHAAMRAYKRAMKSNGTR